MKPFTLVAALALALGGCAAYNPAKDAMLRLTADHAISLDPAGVFSVSPLNAKSIADRNLAGATRQALRARGLSVTEDTDYTYVLSVSSQYKTAEYDSTQRAAVTSYSTGQSGDTVRTSSTVDIPVEKKVGMRMLVFKLYDAHDVMSDVPVVWIGSLIGRVKTIDLNEDKAIGVLVENLGKWHQQSYVVHFGKQQASIELYR